MIQTRRTARLLSPLAVLLALVLTACDGGPTGSDPRRLEGAWSAVSEPFTAQAPAGPVQVRYVDEWRFEEGVYLHQGLAIDASVGRVLGFARREAGTYTVSGETLELRRIVSEVPPGDEPWSLQLVGEQFPIMTYPVPWRVDGTRLELMLPCPPNAVCTTAVFHRSREID
jgi:hypothetical protein